MKNQITGLRATVTLTIASGALVTGFALRVVAQQHGGSVYVPPAIERREAEMANQREARQREMLRESLGRVPQRNSDPRYVQAFLAQIKQDFERIQVVRNSIVRAHSTPGEPDYKFISDAAAEVKKRANRLKSNLALAEVKEDEKGEKYTGELNAEQIRDALTILCHRIESFVRSPVFETPGVVDVEALTKTSRDLRSMIQLGEVINKSADKLSKAAKTTAPD